MAIDGFGPAEISVVVSMVLSEEKRKAYKMNEWLMACVYTPSEQHLEDNIFGTK